MSEEEYDEDDEENSEMEVIYPFEGQVVSTDEAEEYEVQYAERPNKSELKRQMNRLQKMGDRLLGFDPSRLASLNLADKTIDALTEGRRLKALDARRRHLRYLARLLFQEDVAAIQGFIDQIDNPHQAGVATFHQLEVWRERLLAEGDVALTEYLNEYPRADRQQLRQLIRTAQQEQLKGKPPAAYRKLFKLLRTQAELDPDF